MSVLVYGVKYLIRIIIVLLVFQVLTNGIEVKLQRNALSVLEPPTGNEEDDDLDFENTQRNGSDMSKFDSFLIFKDSANFSKTWTQISQL